MSEPNRGQSKPSKMSEHALRQAPQGMQLLKLLTKFFKNMGVLMSVWACGYFNFSTAWVMIGLFMFLANEEYKKVKDSKRAFARDAAVNERQAILARVEELPSWVHFPDVEKAEWLNKMIRQMWPYVGSYTENLLRKTVEPSIQTSLPKSLTPFRFENIDLGDIPPRIGGVKVYTDNVKRDEIIMDLEIFYMGDSQIDINVRGLSAGIQELMVHGTLRVQFRPLIRQMPLIGGMHIYFLNPPKVDFDFTNTANILDLPVLSNTLRTVLEDQMAYYMVLPQKIHISMCNEISLSSLKYPTPQGVVQLHFVAAKDLIGKDKHLVGKKTSDPYCKFLVGSREFKTKTIKENLNPVWNQYFEAVVEEKHGQVVDIEVFDYDATGDDDELGTASLDVQHIYEQGSVDTWLPLEGVKSGMVHVRALWLHLSKNPDCLVKSLARSADMRSQTGAEEHLSSALLLVTVDSAKDLPRSRKSMSEPSPMVKVTVANKTRKTHVRVNTNNPLFEHNFEFLIHNPKLQDLTLDVVDTKKNDRSLGTLSYPIKNLLTAKNMTVNTQFSLRDSSPEAKVHLRLCLRVLSSTRPADWALDTGELEMDEGTSVDAVSGGGAAAAAAAAAQSAGSDVDVAPSGGGGGSGAVTSPASAASGKGEASTAAPARAPAAAAAEKTPVPPAPSAGAADVTQRATASSAQPLQQQPPPSPQQGTPGTELRQRGTAPTSSSAPASPPEEAPPPDFGLGRLRATVRYSAQRNKLVLVVANCVNLQPVEGDSDNSADPYLKIYILPERSSSSKRKSDVMKNNLNPVFDESFDWPMTLSEAQSKIIEITIKNEVGVFSKSRQYIGVVRIDLSQCDLTRAFTNWYPVEEYDDK